MNILVVVDMQNDFITGTLHNNEAKKIIPYVKEKINSFDGIIYATQDTHSNDYLKTLEGQKLPIKHCIKGTQGWELIEGIKNKLFIAPIEKDTFGSLKLAQDLQVLSESTSINSITLMGLCTDICVLANASLLRTFFPNIQIIVDAKGCAGVTIESHKNALSAMKCLQIDVINE